MIFLEKIKKNIYFTLLGVSFVFLVYNGASQIKRIRVLRQQEIERFENNSIEKIKEKFQLMKYISYSMDRKREAVSTGNKYYMMLEIQRNLKEEYFLLSALNMTLDVAYFDENKGINQRESYELDKFLLKYDLRPSDVNNQKRLVVKNGRVLYFRPAAKRGTGYIYQFNEKILKNIVDEKRGEWFIVGGNKNYDFQEEREVISTTKDLLIYDKELEIGFLFKDKNLLIPKILRVLLFYILLPMALVAFAGRYLSARLGEKLYLPLEDILSGIGTEAETEDSGDMKYILNYFGELKNQNKSLKNEVSYMEGAVKEKDLKDYIYGALPDIYFKEKYPELLKESYKAVMLKFDSDNFKERLFVVKGALQNSIEDSIVVNIDNSIYMVIVKDKPVYTKKYFKKLMVEMYKKYEIEGQGFFSDKSYKIENLYRSFSEFYRYLDYKFMLEENIMIDEGDVEKEKSKKYYYPIEIEQRWMNKYTKGNLQGSKAIIDEIFSENFLERKVDTRAFETLKILLFNSLKRLGSEEVDIYQDEFLKISDPFSLKDRLLEILKENEGILVPKEKGNNESMTAEKIEEFIEKNYNKDISLVDLSEHLGVSLQYASNLHKKVKGENFNQYLNRYRIEKSIEILKKDDSVKIKDLAIMVGYINTNTFINNFKKIKGTSPGKYNKL